MEIGTVEDKYVDRIPLAKCRKILGNELLTDEEVLKIRDLLYQIAAIDYRYYYQSNERAKIVAINKEQDDTAKSDPIHPCKYRRAG